MPVVLTRPDSQFGDLATNVAMQLAPRVGKPPREIAETLAEKLRQQPEFSEVTIAGPGFINVRLADQELVNELQTILSQKETYGRYDSLEGKRVVAEYSDPNPFKVLHAGHLYTSVVGDAIANLLTAGGAEVHRVNFGGDVGLHVGKTMWAILQKLDGEFPDKLTEIDAHDRAEWLAERYVEGTNAYEDDAEAKTAIIELNKRVYQLHSDGDHDSDFAKVYWTTRQWSYDYFDEFYDRIGSHFEKYYPESETAPIGLEAVKQHIGDVFEKSDGAVVFKGEKHDLHTRVFINSEGLPTYETKDIGLILKKKQDYDFDRSVVITGNEQQQYMAVVLKALEQFEPALAEASTHLTHGIVKLAGGQKMSSRKGNILSAVDVLEAATAANHEANGKDDELVSLGAVKYAFLKHRMGADIIYDPAESVSLQGNSGPYLQYALVRARAIVRKVHEEDEQITDTPEAGERQLLIKLSQYPEVVAEAAAELFPHHICTYLYELAQIFNQFYEKNRVLEDPRQVFRLQLVRAYSTVLQNGLQVLGIPTPETM